MKSSLNARDFVNQFLHAMKCSSPDLYREQISRRSTEFVLENAPTENGGGQKIGYLNKDLRMLSALARFFRNEYWNLIDDVEGKKEGEMVYCLTGMALNYFVLALVLIEFH